MADAIQLPTDSATQVEGASSSQGSQDQQQDAQQAASSSARKEATSLDDVSEQFSAGAPADGGPEDVAQSDATGHEADEEEGGDPAKGKEADATESENEEDEQQEDEPGQGEEDASLTDPTKPPPFHEHPRWQEIVAERDSLKPLAEQARTLTTYMQQNNISGEDLQGMLEIGALMQSNPEEAYKRLEPILSGLGQLVGRTLPEDLEKQVAEGKMTPATALELAKARAQNRLLQQQRQQDSQRQQQASQQALGAAVAGWVQQKVKTDLAFKQGSPLWEAVNDRLQSLSTAQPPKTPAEATALAERVYTEVKKWFAPPSTVKATVAKTKSLSSNGSSTRLQTKEPTTLDEVAMQATGLRWTVPKKGV